MIPKLSSHILSIIINIQLKEEKTKNNNLSDDKIQFPRPEFRMHFKFHYNYNRLGRFL